MKKLSFTLFTCSIALTGCGSQNRDSKLATLHGQESPKPLVVSMSGFSTCKKSEEDPNQWGPQGHTQHNHALELAAQLKNQFGVEPQVMMSCFTKQSELMTSSTLDQGQVSTPKDEDYLNQVREQMKLHTHVFVVGHSYGGWLSMKLVEGWNDDPNRVRSLHSIDPISKRLCYFDSPRECIHAPKDIGDESRAHIRDMTKSWTNAWQRKTVFLHSSKIQQAHRNPEYNLEHWSMAGDDQIWSDIRSNTSL